MASIPEANALSRGGVDVTDDQLFLELRPARDELTILVDDEAVAVEHELVLTPDQVAEDDIGQVVPGALYQHALTLGALFLVIGRGRDVDYDLCTREGLVTGGRARLPDVLADRQANDSLVHAHERGRFADLEVALLVEDAVVRQEHLPVDGLDF